MLTTSSGHTHSFTKRRYKAFLNCTKPCHEVTMVMPFIYLGIFILNALHLMPANLFAFEQ